MDEQKQTPTLDAVPAENTALVATAPDGQMPTMWNDSKLLNQAYKAAKFLASSELVPEQTYRNKPANCLIALDLANRTGLAPLIVMQNLYIVKGKPGWSGQFCISLINASGRFTPLEFVTMDKGLYCQATRIADGKLCVGPAVTWDMVKAEGWLDKSGSKWKTMPEVMFRYRAASFFAKSFCPELLMGVPTVEELKDVGGYDEGPAPEKIVITMEE